MITTIDVMKNIDVAIEIAMTNASIAKITRNLFGKRNTSIEMATRTEYQLRRRVGLVSGRV